MDDVERLHKLESEVQAIGASAARDERYYKLENEVHAIRGALDWAKIAFTILVAVVLASTGVLVTLNLNTSSKVSGLSDKITEEFRAQRAEQAAQITAISSAVTAAKQQIPQVIIVPSSVIRSKGFDGEPDAPPR